MLRLSVILCVDSNVFQCQASRAWGEGMKQGRLGMPCPPPKPVDANLRPGKHRQGRLSDSFLGSLGKLTLFSHGDNWKKKELGLGRWKEDSGGQGRTDAFTRSLEILEGHQGKSQTTGRASWCRKSCGRIPLS